MAAQLQKDIYLRAVSPQRHPFFYYDKEVGYTHCGLYNLLVSCAENLHSTFCRVLSKRFRTALHKH